MSWTDERVDTLKARWASGLSCSQIGAEMGVTRNAIIGKVYRLKLHEATPRRNGVNPNPTAPRKPRQTKPRPFKPRFQFNASVNLAPVEPAEDEALDLPADQSEHAVALQDLQDHHCRWPLGDPSHDMLSCGADAVQGHPYCVRHCRMAYAPAPTRRERKAWLQLNPRHKATAV